MPRKKKTIEPVDGVELLTKLTAEFCPAVDSAVVSALLSDYADPTTQDERTLRKALRSIAEAADRVDLINIAEGRGAVDGSTPGTSELDLAIVGFSLEEANAQSQDHGSDNPVEFVQQVFPQMSAEAIQARLARDGSNVERLVEELLSEEYIASDSSGTSSGSSGGSAASDHAALHAAKKATRLKGHTISLTSPINLLASPASSRPSTPTSSISTSATSYNNLWVSLDSLAMHLSRLLSVPSITILSYFHAHPSSLSPATTLHAFVSELAAKRPVIAAKIASDFLEALGIEGEGQERDRAGLALRACKGGAMDAMDLLEVLKDTLAVGFEAPFLAQSGTPTALALSRTSSSSAPPSPALRSAVLPAPPLASAVLSTRAPSSAECAELVDEFFRKRNEAFRSAAKHYQRGTIGDRGAAFYWAEQGREFGKQMKTWEGRRAQALIDHRRMDDPYTIDLHGLTVAQAKEIVHNTCNKWWSTPSSQSLKPLRIITGVGNHSTNNVSQLLPAVTKLLDREGWKWKPDGPVGARAQFGAVIVSGVVKS